MVARSGNRLLARSIRADGSFGAAAPARRTPKSTARNSCRATSLDFAHSTKLSSSLLIDASAAKAGPGLVAATMKSTCSNAAPIASFAWILSSSASAATLTGGGISVDRERPCAASGWVATATTSNPSPTRARNEGTANSGVPKNATRTYSSPAGSGVTSLRYPVCPLRDFFHLDSNRLRFTALR